MFSGEVFVLLCTLYFHDMEAVSRSGRTVRKEMLHGIESRSRVLFLNNQVKEVRKSPRKRSSWSRPQYLRHRNTAVRLLIVLHHRHDRPAYRKP